MTNEELLKNLRVVDEIIDDLSDRRGLKQEWHQIDDETKDEIRLKWAQIIHRATSGKGETRNPHIGSSFDEFMQEIDAPRGKEPGK